MHPALCGCLHHRISFMCLNPFECGMLLDGTSKGVVQPSHFPFLLIQLDSFLVSMGFYEQIKARNTSPICPERSIRSLSLSVSRCRIEIPFQMCFVKQKEIRTYNKALTKAINCQPWLLKVYIKP